MSPTIQAVQTTEAELIRSICLESFEDFVREFWPEVIAEPLVWNWHMSVLCDEVQAVAERVIRGQTKDYDLIINISPGTTKSTIVSVMLGPWIWARMTNARLICGSYTQHLALELSVKSRDIVRSDKYKECFPEVQLRDDQNTKSHWKNTKHGDRYACTVGGSVTGMHAHLIIVDDPIDPKGARSEEEIKTANYWMTETLSSRKVDKSVTPIILIMQRLHQNDPTGHLLNKGKDNIRHICLPAVKTQHVKPRKYRKHYRNGLMDPRRLNKSVLREARKDLGAYGYAGQFLQTPIPAGGGWFKVERIQVERIGPDLNPRMRKWKRLVRYWDKAGTRDGGAYTVGALMGLDVEGRIWILDIRRGQWAPGQREKIIKNTAISDGYHVHVGVEQEPGSGGKESAENTAKNLMGWRVILDRPTGDKATRAEPLASMVEADNVYMVAARWNSDLIDELQYFPDSTYKDQVDALSGAFQEITKPQIRLGAL